jgi:hypothetical protein
VLLGLETASDELITLTIPDDVSAEFAIGQRFDLLQYSGMPINIVGAAGVTVYAPFGSTLNDIYAVASVVKIGANEWLFIGPQSEGYTGSIGFTGSVGFTGSSGFMGSIGFTGSRGNTGFTGSEGESSFVFSDDPPINPVAGDRWYDFTTGIEFVWVVDTDSGQWVEITTSGTGFTGSAGPSAATIGTTEQRPASSVNGTMYINITTSFLQVYYNGNWFNVTALAEPIA